MCLPVVEIVCTTIGKSINANAVMTKRVMRKNIFMMIVPLWTIWRNTRYGNVKAAGIIRVVKEIVNKLKKELR